MRQVVFTILLLAVLPLLALTEAETIAQCRRELSPENAPAIRRRAALVVGKYLTPAASRLLGQCLKDADAEVRRNALVSVGEEPMHLQFNRLPVMRCLKDEDITIRRLASSLLQQVFISARNTPPGQLTDSEEFSQLFNAALTDSDAEVRRNTLDAAIYFAGRVDQESILPFLQDSSTEVVCQALAFLPRANGDPNTKAAALTELLRHPDQRVRRELVNAAMTLNAAGSALLQTLSGDESPGIRLQALTALVRLRLLPAEELLSRSSSMLSDAALPADARAQLLRSLESLPGALTLLLRYMEDDTPAPLRAAAWRYAQRHPEHFPSLAIERIISTAGSESDAELRSIAAQMLRSRKTELTAEHFQRLQSAKELQARLLALELSSSCPPAERAEYIREALIDDAVNVRRRALQLLSQVRPDGWLDDLIVTLDEPEAELSQAAALALLPQIAVDERVAPALERYIPRCQEPLLRKRIEEHLKRTANNLIP